MFVRDCDKEEVGELSLALLGKENLALEVGEHKLRRFDLESGNFHATTAAGAHNGSAPTVTSGVVSNDSSAPTLTGN